MDDNKMELILEKLIKLETKLENIETDTKKMSEHINFISQIYDKYKNGLDLVHSVFSRCK